VKSLLDVAWASWVPQIRATLLFVVRDGRILLIRKKRGLGAGKINGPGGKLDPGESALACAVRETQEELCVTPFGVEQRGELRFQFTDGLSILGYVFLARDCHGEARETEEAVPLWTPVGAIPYAEMWADDEIWLPWLLEGRRFAGRMLFDGDSMLGHAFELLPADHVFDTEPSERVLGAFPAA
jgi:8-oxo-dGTP diphosphatase